MIGTEMAAAASAEQRHQQTSHAPSPLAGVSYQPAAGELDLFRFVESAADELVAATLRRAAVMRGDELVQQRDSLTQDDLYTLLTFARRVSLRALRADDTHLADGWLAVALVDLRRVDWRDAAVAAGLLSYASYRTNTAPQLDQALAVASPDMADLMLKYADVSAEGLPIGGYREIATGDGAALAQDHGHSYEPSLDLLSVSHSVAELIEADRYRVTDITTGTQISSAWLRSGDVAADAARHRVKACLSLHAALQETAPTAFPEQMFLVYVAECETAGDAALIARAASEPEVSGAATLAVTHDRLCVLVIARSTVKGVSSVESMESVRRFDEPLKAAVSERT